MKRNVRWARWCAIAAAASTIAVSPALSQDVGVGSYANPLSFGAFAGASIPTGDFGDFGGTGWHAGGMVQWNSPTAPFGFRFDGAYHKFADNSEPGNYPSIINGTANGILTFPMASSTVRPYIIGGIGIYNERCTQCNSQTRAGLNAGAGINVPLSGFATIIEGRFHLVFDSDQGHSNSTFIPISVGLLFR
jgi:hypothetical protein